MDLGKVVGSGWYAGSTFPTTGKYIEGDFFFLTTNNEVYKYTSGSWVDQGYSIRGSKGDTGSAAGFGTPKASASSLEATQSPTASVSASGGDTSKVFDFSFGIPKGADGVIVASSGIVGFQVKSDGHLYVTYSADNTNSFSINDSGHLIFTYE